MFEHINVVIQQFLNKIAKRIVVRVIKIYIQRYFFQQSIFNSFNFFDSQKKQNINNIVDDKIDISH